MSRFDGTWAGHVAPGHRRMTAFPRASRRGASARSQLRKRARGAERYGVALKDDSSWALVGTLISPETTFWRSASTLARVSALLGMSSRTSA